MVIIRPGTRILPGDSGLTRDSIANGDTIIGHTIAVMGGLETGTRRLIADVIVLGPKAP
jgi:hypothetical protein